MSAAISAHELKEHWFNAALRNASIDRDRWRPEAGVQENLQTIGDVYDYYGRLYANNTFLLWAGMASTIGPSFYAAFLDIGLIPDTMRRLAGAVVGRLSRRESRQVAGDLGFFEETFLTMQKKIFEDQASMHEAYLCRGIPEIERLYQARIIDLATFGAWQEIERGRSPRSTVALDNGCRMLLWREQRVIIGHYYDEMMRWHGLEGRAFTYCMTLGGAPSVPGARSQAQVFPLVFSRRILQQTISMITPLARGNIAEFATRWALIERDTLPAYLKYVEQDEAESIKAALTAIAVRAARFRLLARAPALGLAMLTGWRISLVAPDGGARLLSTDSGKPVVFDLETPQAAAAALDLSGSNPTRVWMSRSGRGINVQVRLPGGKVYSEDTADLVAATRFEAGGESNHMVVKLPPAKRDETERVLRRYAADWGLDAGDIDTWKEAATQVADESTRTHGTYVLGPAKLGSVTLEVEVAHHVREGEYDVSALFSW